MNKHVKTISWEGKLLDPKHHSNDPPLLPEHIKKFEPYGDYEDSVTYYAATPTYVPAAPAPSTYQTYDTSGGYASGGGGYNTGSSYKRADSSARSLEDPVPSALQFLFETVSSAIDKYTHEDGEKE